MLAVSVGVVFTWVNSWEKAHGDKILLRRGNPCKLRTRRDLSSQESSLSFLLILAYQLLIKARNRGHDDGIIGDEVISQMKNIIYSCVIERVSLSASSQIVKNTKEKCEHLFYFHFFKFGMNILD